MVSKMFPPTKFASKQAPAGDDPVFRERVVTFCLIDFDDLDLDAHRLAGGSFGDVYRGTWKGEVDLTPLSGRGKAFLLDWGLFLP
jgi:hypothetical protein